ncbi:MAG: sugar ABC transporter permease [Treponema sp.]|nr:sugar ABC transporter permease [Treponema sp.]
MPKSMRKGTTLFIVLMLAIPVLWFVIFYVIVNFNSIIMSFKVVDGVSDAGTIQYKWGFDNFLQLFTELDAKDGDMLIALKNSIKYFALNLFIIIPASYLVSYFLYKKIFGYKFFRVLFYTPSIISAVAMVIIFKNMVGGYGPLYVFCRDVLHFELPALLTNSKTATNTILVYCFWTGFGVNIILYQGAMSRIPSEIMEQSKIDGLPWYKELFKVITPMIWPTLSTTIVLAITGIFTSTGPILLFGTGGAYETYSISYFIFSQVYDSGIYNYPAAIGVFFTLYSIPVVFGIRFIMNKFDSKVEY